MTFVGGFNCKNGLVMVADSLEQDGFVKRRLNKLHILERGSVGNEWGLCVGGAGLGSLVNKFVDKLHDLLPSDGAALDRPSVELQLEATMKYLQQQYGTEIPQFVVGLFSNAPDISRLYRLQDDCLAPQDQCCFVGQDSTLVNFFVSFLFDKVVGVGETVRLAWLLTDLMSQHGDGVEGPINIASVSVGQTFWYRYGLGEMEAIQQHCERIRLDTTIRNWWQKVNFDLHQSGGKLFNS